MRRILIVFASHYGQTRKIAERLGSQLRTAGYEVDVVDVRYLDGAQPTPEDYDVVVLGSRVEVGRHAAGIRNFIADHVDALRRMPTVFFSVSMAAAKPLAGSDPDGYMDTLFGELWWTPMLAVSLAGGLPYRKYGLLTRWLMKRISRAAGHTTDTSRNHEMTDWARVDELAGQIAALTGAARSRPDRGSPLGAGARRPLARPPG